MLTNEIMNKITAGLLSLCIGAVVFIIVYLLLGFITEPLKRWISWKILGGAK